MGSRRDSASARRSAGASPGRTASPGIGRRRLLYGLAATVLVAAIGYGVVIARTRQAIALVPAPAGDSRAGAIAAHVQEHYDAARQAPTSAAALGALCLAYQADMLYERADRCYARLLELAPADWRWTYYRTVIAAERGSANAVVAGMRRVVELAPDFGPAWLRLGDAEFKAGRYDGAEQAWRRAATSAEPARDGGAPVHAVEAPLTAHAALGLARLAIATGHPDSARATLEDVAMRSPRFGSAFRLLAESYRALGRDADAARAIARAGRLPPFAPYADPMIDALARESRNATLLLRMASEADLAVNAEWSEYLTRRALEFDPDNPDVVVKLGRVLRTVGRSEDALAYFRRYHDMVPGDVQGLAHIGSSLSDLGRFAEAEPLLREAAARLDDSVTHYNLGLLLALTGRADEAVREYELALARDPGDLDARGNLAIALVRRGDLGRAARELADVLRRDPDNAMAHANLGIVLLQQGQRPRAAAELREALRLEPRLEQAAEALRSLEQ